MVKRLSTRSIQRSCRNFFRNCYNYSMLEAIVMRSKWMAPIGIVAMLIFGAVVYSRLPDQIPTHWNIYGQVNAMMGRTQAVLLLPALTAGLWLLMLGLPRIDPLRAS